MIDEFAKGYLRNELSDVRTIMVQKLDGLSEYDMRRPLTHTGTNLLGLIKHLSIWEAVYLGEVFNRPFPEPLPNWGATAEPGADMWATEHETSTEIVARYQRVWAHTNATIDALTIDAPGHVPWWPRPDAMLFNILVHLIAETNRHAGHADILREQIDGATGDSPNKHAHQDDALRHNHFTKVQTAADRTALP